MLISFRQGIVNYDTTTFPFLVSGGGSTISLIIGSRPITLSLAQSNNNYTFTETANVNNAWTGLNLAGQSWLYWDFNTSTLVRTFGFTTLQPVAQNTAPLSPATGQMWYNTSTFQGYVYISGGWTPVLRVLAAKYNGSASSPYQFTSLGDQPPLPSGYPNFTGTQIGVNQSNVSSGFPLYDSNGVVIRQSDGTFLTTENQMFAQGAAITGVRLESNVYNAFSSDVTTIPAYSIVAVQNDGTFQLGSYNDAGNTAIAMAIQNIPASGSGAICLEGTLTNPLWNWSNYIGQLLWISGTSPGQLVTSDPHLSNPIAFPIAQPPVARVLSTDTLIFLQGIGTTGQQGPPGGGNNTTPATTTQEGVVFLSSDFGAFTPASNLVIAEGDPRLSNARTATSGSTLAATNITVAPDVPSGTSAPNVQLAIQALGLNKLNLTGSNSPMTGYLTLFGDPTLPYHASSKNYVDTNFLSIETQVVEITGSTMTGPLILSGNPTMSLQAAPKQYVDSIASGITVQASVTATTTTNLNATYSGSTNFTLTEIGNGAIVVDGITLTNGQRVLVKNQTTASQNGIYVVTTAGSSGSSYVLTRDASQTPPNTVISGTYVFVTSGSQNINTGWILSTPNPITLDTTALTFVQFLSQPSLTFSTITNGLGYIPVGSFAVAGSSGISVSGSPVNGATPSGLVLNLSTELQGLNALSSSGLGVVQRTGTGSYVAAPLTAVQVETALGFIPLAVRTINTTAPLTGGGALTGNLTLAISPFTGSNPGTVPTSLGNPRTFLRGDGIWAAPSGRNTDFIIAAAGQTIIPLTNVSATAQSGGISYVQVFRNGILQRENGTYNVISSSQITFTTGLTLNDEIIIYQL